MAAVKGSTIQSSLRTAALNSCSVPSTSFAPSVSRLLSVLRLELFSIEDMAAERVRKRAVCDYSPAGSCKRGVGKVNRWVPFDYFSFSAGFGTLADEAGAISMTAESCRCGHPSILMEAVEEYSTSERFERNEGRRGRRKFGPVDDRKSAGFRFKRCTVIFARVALGCSMRNTV